MISGRTELATAVIAAVSVIALLTDLWKGRIFNWLTLPTLAFGLVAAPVFAGWPALGDAALAVVAAFLLFSWMFWLGIMGAGDVKLLMAVGAWGGLRYTLEVAVLSIALGGVLAFAILLFSGRLPGFFRRLYRFMLTLFVRELELEANFDRKLTMPFGVAIAAAAVWNLFASPLAGVTLWR